MEDFKNPLIARFIAMHCVRNSELENLHAGKSPSSKAGDYSDVKVVTPYGEIPWNELSRISDKEMRELMLDIESRIHFMLSHQFPEFFEKIGKEKFMDMLENSVFKGGVSWDRTDCHF